MCCGVTDARARRCDAGRRGRRDVAVRREAKRRALRSGVGVDIVVVVIEGLVFPIEGLNFETYGDGSMSSEFIRAYVQLIHFSAKPHPAC